MSWKTLRYAPYFYTLRWSEVYYNLHANTQIQRYSITSFTEDVWCATVSGILFLGRVLLRLLTIPRWGHSNHNRLLSRILNRLLSRMCKGLEDLLFPALCQILWHNHHARLLCDWMARLLRWKFLHSLPSVHLVDQGNIHDENYPGDVAETLLIHKEFKNCFSTKCPSINQYISQWFNRSINQSSDRSIRKSINQFYLTSTASI